MKASCPSEKPLTPISRLDAVEKRVDAMIQAVQTLRAPLDTFYSSLTEEQKRSSIVWLIVEVTIKPARRLLSCAPTRRLGLRTLPSDQIQRPFNQKSSR